jgi:hypothetical protein
MRSHVFSILAPIGKHGASTKLTHHNQFSGKENIVEYQFDYVSLAWIIVSTLPVLALIRAYRRKKANAQRENIRRITAQHLKDAIDQKYGPSPIVAAPEPQDSFRDIPYPYQLAPKGKAFRPKDQCK